MAFMAQDGRQADVARQDEYTQNEVNRSKALAMRDFKQHRKWSLRQIGKFFRVSPMTVKRWIDAIPEDAKEYYARSLG